MTKEQFIEIIKGFDIKEIEEYKIQYKDSENHNVTIELGFDEEDDNDVNVANTIIFDLQDRIDKAIEYIQDRYNGEALTHTFDKCNVKELLEILKGEE